MRMRRSLLRESGFDLDTVTDNVGGERSVDTFCGCIRLLIAHKKEIVADTVSRNSF
jgi:hypothetical protein